MPRSPSAVRSGCKARPGAERPLRHPGASLNPPGRSVSLTTGLLAAQTRSWRDLRG
jgi:hypothetical protein